MSHRDISEVEPEGTSALAAGSRVLFLETVRKSNAACQSGDYSLAATLYTEALGLDPLSHVLYSNRSAARLKMGLFALALQDAVRATELLPQWPKAYYRQGVALQCLGRHGEALVAFATGLAKDPSNSQLLSGLVEASLKSPLRPTLEPTFQQLRAMKLEESPFVVISVVGQELLGAGQYKAAAGVLEAALNIGTCSLKLRGSVFSALSSAYWALNSLDKAIGYMQQDLEVARSLGDTQGECRAHGNLGSAYFSKGAYKEALTAHRYQLVLAMKCKDAQSAASALTGLGHAARCAGDLSQAKLWHKRELDVALTTKNKVAEGRACSNLGIVYQLLGEHDAALKLHRAHLGISRLLDDTAEMGRAYCNLGLAHLELGNVETSLECQKYYLVISHMITHTVGQFRALGYIGDCLLRLGETDEAIKMHKRQLYLARRVGDRSLEAAAYGALGNAYGSRNSLDKSLSYHVQELTSRQDAGDLKGECRAHSKLGAVHMTLCQYTHAIKCYQEQLDRSRELGDLEVEAQALGNLGIARLNMGHYEDAIGYFEQQLAAGVRLKSARDQEQAYKGLGRARESLGNLPEALVCYEKRLVAAHEINNPEARSSAYCDLGRVHLLMDDPDSALNLHQLELSIAENLDAGLQARACANLGATQEILKHYDEAISLYERSLSLAAAAGDQNARVMAFSSLGRLHHLRGDYQLALSYLQSGLSLSEGLGKRKEVAKLRHRLGLVYWQTGEASIAVEQLEKAANLLESFDGISNTFNSQTKKSQNLLLETYGTLQKILISLNRPEEALNWAERSRLTKFNNPDDIIHYSEIIDRQRGIVLYYSELENKLNAWCLAPNKGLLRFHSTVIPDGVNLEQQVIQSRDALLGESSDLVDENSKIPSRGHRLNASSYSLSSLFSVGSASSRAGSARWGRGTKGPTWLAPTSIQSLYDLLLAPFEDLLPPTRKELILVVEKSLYLAPFPALQAAAGEEYLCERFSLLVVPSLAALKKRFRTPMPKGEATVAALVIGNPSLSEKLKEEYGWPETTPSAETEAGIVAEILESRPLIGVEANRSAVLRSFPDAECIHLTTPILWNSNSFVLTPDQSEETSERSENLLSSSDIMKLRLTARLVVLSSGHYWSNDENISKMSSDSIQSMARTFLNAGAQCVLISMWPVPSTAGSILLRAFYCAMLQGARASRALAEAMQTVQHTRHFAHPANWAGWLLLGGDARLSNKVALMGQALADLLRSGPENCRDALQVTLHLVEKSLQRIHRGQKNAMYTTQRSIENKVGSATGWRELLMSVGFRFEPAGNGIPSSVFFPQSDPEDRLTRCSASLQALLGLGLASLHALVKLLQVPEVGEDVITAMRKVSCISEGQEVILPVRIWRASGSHELFASLGFDLMEVGQSEVTLRFGKQASRRAVQFALQALLALFDTQEAPKSLSLDSGSSMESLVSVAQPDKSNILERPRLGGAFASYVRHRGEPDGKTTEPPNVPFSRQYPNERGESDVAFTPSPVAHNFNHQTRIRNLYQEQTSSSSSSSVTDWESGHNTILRRQPLPSLPTAVLDRLSVRTELGSVANRKIRASTKEKMNHQTKTSQSNEGISHSMRNLTTSLANRTRELTPTMSEVYYERNLGLGLAPSLSKLLEEVVNINENDQRQFTKPERNQTQNWQQNEPEFCRRDEADGRSIAESQCSAASSKIHRKAPLPPV